jgi:hypothetical protein
MVGEVIWLETIESLVKIIPASFVSSIRTNISGSNKKPTFQVEHQLFRQFLANEGGCEVRGINESAGLLYDTVYGQSGRYISGVFVTLESIFKHISLFSWFYNSSSRIS